MMFAQQAQPTSPAIALLTGDLMFSSRVTGTASQLGLEVAVLATATAVLEQCADQQVSLLIIDLSHAGGDIQSLIKQLEATGTRPKTVLAFGPHVQTARLEAARQAGCDQVVSRGQFNAGLRDFLAAI